MLTSACLPVICRVRFLACFLAAIGATAQALAGSYSQNFNAAAVGATALGDGSTISASAGSITTSVQQVFAGNNALQMMITGFGGNSAAYKLADLDPTKPIQSFDATFKVKMNNGGSPAPGAGWSLNFGAIPGGNGAGEGGFVMAGGLTIAWDIYNNGGSDVPSIEVFAGGVSVGNSPRTFTYDETLRTVAIHWDLNGLDVTYDGVVIFTDLAVPGFVPLAGNKFAFSVRNEPSNTMVMWLDDVVMATTIEQPVETGGPVISEFMADNSSTLEDEDTDSPDWIEIYNGQNATVNLAGWRLTNIVGNNALWTFPSVSVGPYGYLVVYASGKNRTTNPVLLHTNFTLQKESGYLALVKADGATIAAQFVYGAQYQDISYGEKGQTRTLGYLQPASPGSKVSLSTSQAPGGPAEDVVWSRDGGLITGATPLTIAAPLAAGAVVRYTTNNTEPGSASPIYATPFSIASSTTIRARVFTPNLLPGAVSSRTLLQIDSSLLNYNGSGQPFSTNVPIVVMDSFGVPVDSYTATTQRDYRLNYVVVIAPNPVTGRATITDAPDFQGRCGTHVRGESSAGFPQRQYGWELWDNSNSDKSASILGMPANSDWILYAPWSDKSLMRDVLTFGTMRKLRTDYMAVRTKFCELIYNQTAGAAVGYGTAYKGIYAIKEKLKIGKDRVDIAKLNLLTTQSPAVTGGYIFRKDKADPDNPAVLTTAAFGGVLSFAPDLLNAAETSSLQGYINGFEAALNAGSFADPATGYAAWMETDTFIDAQWFVEWTKQVDGYVFSTYFHKDRNGRLRAGPIWDFNISLGNADYATGDAPTGWLYDTAGTATGTGQLWYPRLHQDPWYRLRHFDRYWELRRGLLATNAITGDIDSYAATLLNGSATPVTNSMAALPPAQENAVMRHYRLFPRLGQYDWPNAPGYAARTTYQSEVSYMKTWLTTRLAWLDEQNFTGSVIYRPPTLSAYGGNVNAGAQVTIVPYAGTPPTTFTYATGTIYYTTNGSDPRGTNGTPAGSVYGGALTLNTSQVVKARLYNGGNWSPITSGTFVVNAAPASAANLVVSEIMYDPPAATAAEVTAGYSTNDFEYIELLNVGATAVDLTNVAFTDGVLFNFGTANPTLLTVPVGGRVVLAGDANAFALRYGSNPAVKVTGPFSGNLSNGGELVTLVGASAAVIANFTFGTAEPWPVDAHGGTGYSLVLNNPAPSLGSAYYNDGANWRSSGTLNGTPGLANSTPFTGSPTGDTDGDGVKDFFEYATGSNMNSATSRNLPVTSVAPFTVAAVTQNYLKLDYRRNLAADGVHYSVQYCSDLATWVSDPASVTYVGTHNNGDGTATVTWRTTQPADAAHPRMFLRLSVSP